MGGGVSGGTSGQPHPYFERLDKEVFIQRFPNTQPRYYALLYARVPLFPAQKFDSGIERRFAVIPDDDKQVLKWFKPSRGDFAITYAHSSQYEPDFAVETETCKYPCEPKRADQLQPEEAQAKAMAAVTWCAHATEHAKNADGNTPK